MTKDKRYQNTNYGTNLRYLRMLNGFASTEMADKCGISKSTYTAYENFLSQPRLDVAVKIAKVLNTTVEDMVTKKAVIKWERGAEG